jgi:uncharacterized protein YndB with AHSA1/START domain
VATDKEKAKRPPVHKCRKVTNADETPRWFTSCGLKLTKDERKDVVLADEWEHVTCKECKKKSPAVGET